MSTPSERSDATGAGKHNTETNSLITNHETGHRDQSPHSSQFNSTTTNNQPHEPETSVIQYLGPNSSYCGYCKRSERESGSGRRCYDMQTYSLKPRDYQDMLDRNWRRSGTYSYCPINQTTCCPNYPIICSATKFHLTRSHRRCIAKINSYLATGDPKQGINLDYSKDLSHYQEEASKKKVKTLNDLELSSKLRDKRFLKSCERKANLYGKSKQEAMNNIREKWNSKLQSRPPLENYLFPKRVMFVDNERNLFKPKHKLEIDMLHVNSDECIASRDEQHQMLVRYQKAIHKENRREWTMARFCDFLVETPLITERLTTFDYVSECSSNGGGALSVKVGTTEASEYLLVAPPRLPTAFGTYHCNYRLDGKLIATGVLDVLPKCITTVYFFYDPDYGFLNLGIYSALIEISIVRQMDRHFVKRNEDSENQLINYYLGFYVPECKKMHYKTRFRPSFLLCSKTLCYVLLETCLKKLNGKKYADFADKQSEDDSYKPKVIDLITIPIQPPVEGLDSSMMAYITWIESNLGLEYLDLFVNGYLLTYAKLIGLSLLPRLTMRVNVVHLTLIERYKRINKGGHLRQNSSTI